jgi:hypothetical protein
VGVDRRSDNNSIIVRHINFILFICDWSTESSSLSLWLHSELPFLSTNECSKQQLFFSFTYIANCFSYIYHVLILEFVRVMLVLFYSCVYVPYFVSKLDRFAAQ